MRGDLIVEDETLNLVLELKNQQFEKSNQVEILKKYIKIDEIDSSTLKIFTNKSKTSDESYPEIIIFLNPKKKQPQKKNIFASEVKLKPKLIRKESLFNGKSLPSRSFIEESSKSRIPVYTCFEKSSIRATKSTFESSIDTRNRAQPEFTRSTIENSFLFNPLTKSVHDDKKFFSPVNTPKVIPEEKLIKDDESNVISSTSQCNTIATRPSNTTLDFSRDIFLSEFLVSRIRLLIDERLEYVKVKYYEELNNLAYPLNYNEFELNEIRIYFKYCQYLLEEFYFIGSSMIMSNCFNTFYDLRKGSSNGMFYLFKDKNSKLIEMHNRQLAFDLWQNKLIYELKKGLVKSFNQFRHLGAQVRREFDGKSFKDNHENNQKTWKSYVESFFNDSILKTIKESLFKLNNTNEILSFNVISLIKFILSRLSLEERIYITEIFNDGIYKIAHKTLHDLKHKYQKDMDSLKIPLTPQSFNQTELQIYNACLIIIKRSVIGNEDLVDNIEKKFSLIRSELSDRYRVKNHDAINEFNLNLAKQLWETKIASKINVNEIRSSDELKRTLSDTEIEYNRGSISGTKENIWQKWLSQIDMELIEQSFKNHLLPIFNENSRKFYNPIAFLHIDTSNTALKRELHLAEKDKFGNLADSRYDLGKDGAFNGMMIAVLQFYNALTFDFEKPKAALKEKGFSLHRWIRDAPSLNEFQNILDKSCQLWIISSSSSKLSDAHLQIIKKFFEQGKGIYLWGDNEPYFMDANKVVKSLGVSGMMSGNTPGGKIVNSGIRSWHPIATGLNCIFEGITISSIKWNNNDLDALIYGSEDNVVCAVYEKSDKRMILDGGFTRLFCNWDSAGTSRYIKNSAVWLSNVEKFGSSS